MNEEMSDKQKFHVLCENENCRWSMPALNTMIVEDAVGCSQGTPNDCGENLPFLKAEPSPWHDERLSAATNLINAYIKGVMDVLGMDEINRFPSIINTRFGVLLVWGRYLDEPPPNAVTYYSSDEDIMSALRLKQSGASAKTA